MLDEISLPNHPHVHIRPLRANEHALLAEFFARLSPKARYYRFLSPFSALPDSLVQLLASVDGLRSLSLVAEEEREGHPVVIAVGSFSAVDGESVEVAIAVEDGSQQLGLGTALIDRLLHAAEARGFHRFIVHILAENPASRRLLERFGRVVSTQRSGGVSEVAFVRR